VLVLIGGVFALRLNSAKISQHFYQQLNDATDAQLSAAQSSLTVMHGVGLRLDDVTVSHTQYQIQASHMNISLRLLPLLLGDIKVDSLDIHDATITIQPKSLAPTSTAIATLPIERIHLIRSRIQTTQGTILLDHLQLDMRNIGANSETLWEMDARQGKQVVSGTGRLNFRSGQLSNGFSKVKMEHFQFNRLQAFAPPALMHWLNKQGDALSGTVTLDINKHQAWSLFGSVELNHRLASQTTDTKTDEQSGKLKNPQAVAPRLTLRGKLSHLADGKLIWRDSFINLGDQAVVSIDGTCQQNGDCTTRLNAKKVPLSAWISFIPDGMNFIQYLSANTNLNATIDWNHQQWQGNGSVQLSQAKYNQGNTQIVLPALQLQASELTGSTGEWQAKLAIRIPDNGEIIQLRTARQHNGDQDLFIDSSQIGSILWQPLGRVLLDALGLNSDLEGEGNIQASLHLHRHKQQHRLNMDIDAGNARLHYGAWLEKTENMIAKCQMDIGISDVLITAIGLQNCQFFNTSVGKLTWQQHQQKQTLKLQDLNLDISQFTAHLPEHMQQLSGHIAGQGTTSWHGNATWAGKNSWLKHLSGDWQIKQLGMDNWHANGNLDATQGIFSSHDLQLNGSYGQAEFTGSFNPFSQHGDVDIISGQLNRTDLLDANDPGHEHDTPATTPYWQQITLRGHIRQAKLQFLDNTWQDIQSDYTLTHGQLTLHTFQSTLADGNISSRQLQLTPSAEGINIQGDLRAKHIQLKKLARLHSWLQSALDGKLQANVILHGRIGQTQLADWQRSNGDILIYDGAWKQSRPAISLTEKMGIQTPELKSYAFRKLAFRFNISDNMAAISHISITHHQQHYKGKASINPDLQLQGSVTDISGQHVYINTTTLPIMDWQLQAQ